MQVTGVAGTAGHKRNPMHASADNDPSSRPVLMRFLVRSWEYRRPRLAVGVRVACGIFNVVLGVVLLASAPWSGPLALLGLLPLAGAALIFWTVYRLQQDSDLRVRELGPESLAPYDDGSLFENVNTPHDHARARGWVELNEKPFEDRITE